MKRAVQLYNWLYYFGSRLTKARKWKETKRKKNTGKGRPSPPPLLSSPVEQQKERRRGGDFERPFPRLGKGKARNIGSRKSWGRQGARKKREAPSELLIEPASRNAKIVQLPTFNLLPLHISQLQEWLMLMMARWMPVHPRCSILMLRLKSTSISGFLDLGGRGREREREREGAFGRDFQGSLPHNKEELCRGHSLLQCWYTTNFRYVQEAWRI